jgi:HK97 family phage portal protein
VRSLVGSILAKTPVPYTEGTGRSLSTFTLGKRRPGERELKAMGGNGTLFAIVDSLAGNVSQVTWDLFRKAASGLKEDRTPVTMHPALDLLRKPNEFYTQQEFVETGQQHFELTGEWWWLLVFGPLGSGYPIELWPVRPDRMEPVPSVRDFIAGYVYHGPGGEDVPLDVREVKLLKRPNPEDLYRGLGPIASILADLDAERSAAEWNRLFFTNSAEPGGIIKLNKTMGDTEFRRFRARWNEQHQGVAAAHRVAVLEEGEWIDRKITQRDMQFAELRRVNWEAFRQAYGYPKPLLGAVDDVNRANAEAGEVIFSRWKIVPRCERIKGLLNNDILPLYGPDAARTLEFDYQDPTPPDREADNAERDSLIAAATAYVTMGFEPLSTCEAFGLPVAELRDIAAPTAEPGESDADTARAVAELLQKVYLATSGGVVISVEEARAIANRAGAGLVGPPPEPAAAPAAALPGGDTPAALMPAGALAPAAVLARKRRHLHGHAHVIDIRAEITPQLARVQQDWEDALNALMADWPGITAGQRAALHDQIRAALEAGDPTALAELTVDTGAAADRLAAAMESLTAIAADRMATEAAEQDVTIPATPGSMDVLAPFAVAAAGLLGSAMAVSAGREALRLAGGAGTASEIADEVAAFLAGQSDAYPRDVLGGALSNAQNEGRISTLEAAPSDVPVPAYYADETLDGNTCVNCRQVDGKWLGNTIDAVREVYPNGGYRDCLGRERCRGTVTAIWRPGV